MNAPDVSKMNRAQLIEHIDGCDDCGSDDPEIRTAARDDSLFLGDLRDYVETAHDPRWKAIAGRTK